MIFKKKKFIIIISVIIAALAIFILFWRVDIIFLDGRIFLAEIARNQKEWQKGLGERESICRRCAMLFDFPREADWSFWMKDMRFDLDILWVSKGKIVHIEKNISASSQKNYQAMTFSDKVVEINAGLADKLGIEVGDSLLRY